MLRYTAAVMRGTIVHKQAYTWTAVLFFLVCVTVSYILLDQACIHPWVGENGPSHHSLPIPYDPLTSCPLFHCWAGEQTFCGLPVDRWRDSRAGQ